MATSTVVGNAAFLVMTSRGCNVQ